MKQWKHETHETKNIFWDGGIIQNLLGDLNGDNSIDILDIVLIVSIITDNNEYNPIADFNNDGFVDVLDIVQIINIILD